MGGGGFRAGVVKHTPAAQRKPSDRGCSACGKKHRGVANFLPTYR